jgi:hypothetical protein
MMWCECPHEDCGAEFEHFGKKNETTCCPECGRQQMPHPVKHYVVEEEPVKAKNWLKLGSPAQTWREFRLMVIVERGRAWLMQDTEFQKYWSSPASMPAKAVSMYKRAKELGVDAEEARMIVKEMTGYEPR